MGGRRIAAAAGPTRGGKPQGDPVRVAQAIVDAVAFASTPPHLLLGTPTIYRARKDLDDKNRDVHAWAATTRGADHREAAVTTL